MAIAVSLKQKSLFKLWVETMRKHKRAMVDALFGRSKMDYGEKPDNVFSTNRPLTATEVAHMEVLKRKARGEPRSEEGVPGSVPLASFLALKHSGNRVDKWTEDPTHSEEPHYSWRMAPGLAEMNLGAAAGTLVAYNPTF